MGKQTTWEKKGLAQGHGFESGSEVSFLASQGRQGSECLSDNLFLYAAWGFERYFLWPSPFRQVDSSARPRASALGENKCSGPAKKELAQGREHNIQWPSTFSPCNDFSCQRVVWQWTQSTICLAGIHPEHKLGKAFAAIGTSRLPHLIVSWLKGLCCFCGFAVMFFLSAEADSCLSPDQGCWLHAMLSSGEGDNTTLQSSFPGTAHSIPREAMGDRQGSLYLS